MEGSDINNRDIGYENYILLAGYFYEILYAKTVFWQQSCENTRCKESYCNPIIIIHIPLPLKNSYRARYKLPAARCSSPPTSREKIGDFAQQWFVMGDTTNTHLKILSETWPRFQWSRWCQHIYGLFENCLVNSELMIKVLLTDLNRLRYVTFRSIPSSQLPPMT